jgi:hypothetical protein
MGAPLPRDAGGLGRLGERIRLRNARHARTARRPTYDLAEDLAELLGMWIDRLGIPAEKLYSR